MSWGANWFLLLLGILTIWIVFLGVIFVLIALIKIYSSEYFVSNKRIFIKYGLISRRIYDIKTEWVTNFVISQGIMGRILNFGDLIVSSPGEFGGAAKMVGVTNVYNVKTLIEKTIRESKK